MEFGPRFINYQTSDGESGAIEIVISLNEPTYSVLDDGSRVSDHSGFAQITSEVFSGKINATGMDDCQVAFRAMWYCDGFLQKMARDHNLRLSALQPGDIVQPFDVFSV